MIVSIVFHERFREVAVSTSQKPDDLVRPEPSVHDNVAKVFTQELKIQSFAGSPSAPGTPDGRPEGRWLADLGDVFDTLHGAKYKYPLLSATQLYRKTYYMSFTKIIRFVSDEIEGLIGAKKPQEVEEPPATS
jgi:hypothetical protein